MSSCPPMPRGSSDPGGGVRPAPFLNFTTTAGGVLLGQDAFYWVDLMPRQGTLGLYRFSMTFYVQPPPGGLGVGPQSFGNAQFRILTFCGGVRSIEFASAYIVPGIRNYSGRYDFEAAIESVAVQAAASITNDATDITPVVVQMTMIGQP